MNSVRFIAITGILMGLWAPAQAAKPAAKKAAAPTKAKSAPAMTPTAPAASDSSLATSEGQSPNAALGLSPKKSDSKSDKVEGDMGTVTSIGEYKGKLVIGKFDPPAAFNLEDIQNFPEDRLQPVLQNPINFEEGRDFSGMMDNIEDQLYHPWLPEISRAPYLTMQISIDQSARDWTFAVIDQSGATVAQVDGKGNPPAKMTWMGDDKIRDRAAVDTVYIPQLLITNKDGYRRTYQGQPVQFASVMYTDKGKTVIEISSKRLFKEKKVEFTKEAFVYLNKVCDAIRENNFLPFAVQPFEAEADLAGPRQQAVIKFLSEKLYIPESQIVASSPADSEKRGSVISIQTNSTPGGTGS